MDNNQQPTTALVPTQQLREKLPALIESNLPNIIKWHDRADIALDQIVKVSNEEEYEEAQAVLAAVRDVYGAISKNRKEITEVTDQLKKALMDYERPFDPNSDKSKYSEKRKMLEQYKQAEHERIMKEKREAARRTELQNHKVDLKSEMLSNLNKMLMERVKLSDTGSKDFFDNCTLETFDAKAETFKMVKPKLKIEAYEACFKVTHNPDKITAEELQALINEVKAEEPFDKWNEAFLEQAMPIINAWRARIPELKKQKEELAELEKKNADEAAALRARQKEEEERLSRERQAEIDRQAEENRKRIEEEASMSKMSNAFAEQAATQQLDTAPRTKLVMKFTNMEMMPKAFMTIVYHCVSHKDFPGIQRRDAKKKLMVDDKGRPEYVPAIDWWLDFFVKNCDAHVEGTVVYEDAIITIRK